MSAEVITALQFFGISGLAIVAIVFIMARPRGPVRLALVLIFLILLATLLLPFAFRDSPPAVGNISVCNQIARLNMPNLPQTGSENLLALSPEQMIGRYGSSFTEATRESYDGCVSSIRQNPNIRIDPSTQIDWSPGEPAAKADKDGRDFPHYTMHLGFWWVDTAGATSRAWVAFSIPKEVITSSASWGTQSTDPYKPANRDDPFVESTIATIQPGLNTVSSLVIISTNAITVTISVQKAGAIKLIFPAKH